MAFRTRLESVIQSEILKYLNAVPNSFCFKTISVNKRGIPDISFLYKGRAIYFEVKQPGRKPHQLQEHQMSKILSAGGYAYVVTSLDEVKDIIKSIG